MTTWVNVIGYGICIGGGVSLIALFVAGIACFAPRLRYWLMLRSWFGTLIFASIFLIPTCFVGVLARLTQSDEVAHAWHFIFILLAVTLSLGCHCWDLMDRVWRVEIKEEASRRYKRLKAADNALCAELLQEYERASEWPSTAKQPTCDRDWPNCVSFKTETEGRIFSELTRLLEDPPLPNTIGKYGH